MHAPPSTPARSSPAPARPSCPFAPHPHPRARPRPCAAERCQPDPSPPTRAPPGSYFFVKASLSVSSSTFSTELKAGPLTAAVIVPPPHPGRPPAPPLLRSLQPHRHHQAPTPVSVCPKSTYPSHDYPSRPIRVGISESVCPSRTIRVGLSESAYPSRPIRVFLSEDPEGACWRRRGGRRRGRRGSRRAHAPGAPAATRSCVCVCVCV